MRYCLNPHCQWPENVNDAEVCQSCGDRLCLDHPPEDGNAGCYVALKPLGQGGFGRTFLAADLSQPDRPLRVIKQFLPQSSNRLQHDKAVELFQQEAERLQTLGNHPQIPNLYAYLEQDGQQYLIQEFIDGCNLEQVLAESGNLSEDHIRHLLLDLLPVLRFIHQHQIIHRDIKPANIILPHPPASQHPYLVDLGAAKYATDTALAQTGTVIGSAEFTAPEQARGKATFASDLYSLGATCVYLLTGVSPFELYDTSEGKWVWRDYLQQPVSEALGHILDQLLEPATRRRYPSADAVLGDLESPSRSPLSPPEQSPALDQKIPLTQPTQPEQPLEQQAWVAQVAPLPLDPPRENSGDRPPVVQDTPPPLQVKPLEPAPLQPQHFKEPERVGQEPLQPRGLPQKQKLLILALVLLLPIAIASQWMARSVAPETPETPETVTLPSLQPGQNPPRYTLKTARPGVAQMSFSPDGSYLVAHTLQWPDDGRMIEVWDLNTQRRIRTIDYPILSARLNDPPGLLRDLFILDGSEYRQVNPLTGEEGVRVPASLNQVLLASHNGQTLLRFEFNLTSPQVSMSLWNQQTGNLLNRFQTEVLVDPREDRIVLPAVLSPEGNQVAIARQSTSTLCAIEVRDVRSGNLLHTVRTAPSNWIPNQMLFSLDGKQLVVRTRSQFSANDRLDEQTELWDLSSGELIATFPANGLLVTPRNNWLINLDPDEGIQVRELPTGRVIRTLHASQHASTPAISSDGFTLAWRNGNSSQPFIHISDLRTGTRIRTLVGTPPAGEPIYGPYNLVFSDDGTLLAGGSNQGTIDIWKVFDTPR